MSELKEWPPSIIFAGASIVLALIAFPIGIGYLAGPGVGWLVFSAIMLFNAKQGHNLYKADRQAQEKVSE